MFCTTSQTIRHRRDVFCHFLLLTGLAHPCDFQDANFDSYELLPTRPPFPAANSRSPPIFDHFNAFYIYPPKLYIATL